MEVLLLVVVVIGVLGGAIALSIFFSNKILGKETKQMTSNASLQEKEEFIKEEQKMEIQEKERQVVIEKDNPSAEMIINTIVNVIFVLSIITLAVTAIVSMVMENFYPLLIGIVITLNAVILRAIVRIFTNISINTRNNSKYLKSILETLNKKNGE